MIEAPDSFNVVAFNANYTCELTTEPEVKPWAFPVGQGVYTPERWYVASHHDLTGKLNNGYKHTGIDINLDIAPRGDIERTLGLSVFAVADGIVTYLTSNWSGVPMLVIRTEHDGAPLWIRYAHIISGKLKGQPVKAGEAIGTFANWTKNDGGDHLHLDMCFDEIERDWLTPKRWVDPVEILKAHLDTKRVQAMVARG